MSPRTGRPKSDDAKRYMVRIRMNESEAAKLDYCCKAEAKGKSELIRSLISERFDSLQK